MANRTVSQPMLGITKETHNSRSHGNNGVSPKTAYPSGWTRPRTKWAVPPAMKITAKSPLMIHWYRRITPPVAKSSRRAGGSNGPATEQELHPCSAEIRARTVGQNSPDPPDNQGMTSRPPGRDRIRELLDAVLDATDAVLAAAKSVPETEYRRERMPGHRVIEWAGGETALADVLRHPGRARLPWLPSDRERGR